MDAGLRRAISKLGSGPYVPGSSASKGWLYNPLPFPGCHNIPCHRNNSGERWDTISAHTDFGSKSVFDIGCATGYFSFKAIQAGADSVHGIDHDHNAVNVCRVAARVFGVHNATFEQVDAKETAPPLERYDIVFAMSVLNWLGQEQAERWLDWAADSSVWVEMPLRGDGRAGAKWLIDNAQTESWLRKFFNDVMLAGRTWGTHCKRWRSLFLCR